MKRAIREEWMKLCEQAAAEQDTERLLELIGKINQMLDEKEMRLKRERPGVTDIWDSMQYLLALADHGLRSHSGGEFQFNRLHELFNIRRLHQVAIDFAVDAFNGTVEVWVSSQENRYA